MPIELLPIVSWITQDSSASYQESLETIVSSFHGLAHTLLVRHAPPEKSGCEPRDLVLKALFKLQRAIFDQYLPPIERNRTRSVGGIWADWNLGAMKLMLDTGRVYHLSPLPEGNGIEHQREIDGVTYKFLFYSNDSERQRRRWLHQALKEEALSEGRGTGHRKGEVQIDETWDPKDESVTSIEAGLRLEEWVALTDRDDWSIVSHTLKGGVPKERKALSRAKARLLAAYNILFYPPPSGVSRPFRERLRKAEDGERKTILEEYLRRYPEQGRAKNTGG